MKWSTIHPFCGQLTSVEPSEFPINAATIKLYRAKTKHLACCDGAESLGNLRLNKKGNFDLRKLPPGQYWIIATWKEAEVPIALWSTGKYHFACDNSFNTVIEIKPSTKTVEVTVITSTDSLPHAQTH